MQTGETVKIVGSVRASAPTLTSPLTGTSCVWYTSRVKPYRPPYVEGGPPIIETRFQDLFIDDDSGSALVRMDRAEVSLASMSDAWQREPSHGPVPEWPPDPEPYLATTDLVRAFLEARGIPIRNRPPNAFWGFFYRLSTYRSGTDPNQGRARYREDVLQEGARVAVLGKAWHEPDPAAAPINMRQPALRLVLGDPPDSVIASNEPEFL